jgi:hypothetical protein
MKLKNTVKPLNGGTNEDTLVDSNETMFSRSPPAMETSLMEASGLRLIKSCENERSQYLFTRSYALVTSSFNDLGGIAAQTT